LPSNIEQNVVESDGKVDFSKTNLTLEFNQKYLEITFECYANNTNPAPEFVWSRLDGSDASGKNKR
jgi:hypothetical protein